MILDTLKLKTKLEHAGMDDRLAVVIADALGNADIDQLATKADLRTEIDTVKAEIATVKADLQTDIATVKADLQTEIATVKADLQTEIATVKADLYRALWIQWGATVAAVTAIVTISKLF